MPRYDAVLLDLDGLLVDTETVARAAGLAALTELGHRPPPDLLDRLIGLDRRAGHAILRQHLGDALDLDALDRTWRVHVDRHYATHGLNRKPGVEGLFQALDRLAMPRAIVTSSYRVGARRKLALADLTEAVQVIVAVDDVARAKPHPEPYLRGAELLGVPPDRCLAFEDSGPGAAAARAAGCTVVQVPEAEGAPSEHAHHVASDLLSGARLAGLIP